MDNQLRDLIFIGSELLIRDIFKDDKYKDKKRLETFGFKGNSQTDEAGIIQEIFNRIGTTNKTFIEFGVGGKENENNTWHFIKDGWNGLWLEGNQERVTYLSELLAGPIKDKRLQIGCELVYPDNINKLIKKYKIPKDIDMLNIDIDSIDYWVWDNIDKNILNPRVIIIEYNAKYPPPMEWIKVNDKTLRFDKTDSMGASLKSLELLGRKKGYSLVGCCISGANAFFIRDDLLDDNFSEPYTAEHHYQPARYYICKSTSGSNYDYSGMKNSYCSHVGKNNKLFN
jgi:hypothetical protein